MPGPGRYGNKRKGAIKAVVGKKMKWARGPSRPARHAAIKKMKWKG